MATETRVIETERGDRIRLTITTHAGEPAAVLVQIDDVDASIVPTVELLAMDIGPLREELRELGELARVHNVREGYGRRAPDLEPLARSFLAVERHG